MSQHRRALAVTAAVASLALALSACGGGSDSTDGTAEVAANPDFASGSTMARLAKAGKITIGTKFDVPLFGLKGLDGKPAGFDVEIAKIIAGKLGIAADDITWVETPSKVRDEYLAQGKADMITATYTITDDRRTRVTFAGPYYNAGSTLMVKSDNKEIVGPKSLKEPGLKVCTATGAIDAEVMKKYLADPDDQLVQFDVFSKCADALRTGQVDAVTTDSAILLGFVAASKGKFKTVGDTFYDQPFGIGIKKGDVEFCEFVNDVLTESVKDGSYEKAWKKTVGDAAPETPELPALGPCE
ncbi:glutamate ABC transporter substrate-binding protein [Streptomyces sp. PSKA54]|uniref:Glutamate ABC transporter substrate-binding protein n=1 Tax=Streptomyces himalayensis subsp. aureolus TaxID=2758039 RepID=A0A7W2HK86_9ACTN|nr:glutamate ABC transporter substrate-binding protein [Streptomyces himalayensis]MBA4866927.1 glutamate ABC transporter substrate-binding protein [Streptomyces himalayensis subsp. aureolus]